MLEEHIVDVLLSTLRNKFNGLFLNCSDTISQWFGFLKQPNDSFNEDLMVQAKDKIEYLEYLFNHL